MQAQKKGLGLVYRTSLSERKRQMVINNSKIKLTWAGPQAIPTICFVSNPGRAAGSGLVIRKVSKCWHWSLLPQLCTSLSSVSAKQWVDPAATSITFFPDREVKYWKYNLKIAIINRIVSEVRKSVLITTIVNCEHIMDIKSLTFALVVDWKSTAKEKPRKYLKILKRQVKYKSLQV